ncbi:MAG: hypothetical protein COS43_00485 [Gallionellales bacterium CG03_land_8_20_14_0_80_55_15]|nr:MAG: hypothetical protein COS43_00485 [Gallionellales bacterium CG03_land_8_20_14_0_80_55_15]PIV92141.1 MAG: hypothetical protein COW45_01260 [Gallionellales bacterium CG17_big_fil_post_rev_8_21_14_2_50_54_146]PIX04302.1 MAG: hypothetical protein COZ77_07205 [Gallionellales bacterium CG_4_8_14_3_um_filter_54_18]PJB06343.1 MAG: hypothetical protein CO125_07280 [Hydrogenophilales bacterium CG_4_9_14_3_um_filter_59_35]PJC05004.1 MAG: hypothetical protein CO070_03175 [Gallionellales bacterium CG
MLARLNLFVAWFLIPQTLVLGWVAATGRLLLGMLGANTHEGDIPSRMTGALLVFGAVYLVMHFRGTLPPEGKPEGKGYTIGQRLVLAGNLLAGLYVAFQLSHFLVENRAIFLIINGFTDAFGYWAMACWVIGFSFLYQSSLPNK